MQQGSSSLSACRCFFHACGGAYLDTGHSLIKSALICLGSSPIIHWLKRCAVPSLPVAQSPPI